MKWALVAIVSLLQILAAVRADACSLPPPRGTIILTMKGEIQGCNSEAKTSFDLAMLEALPRTIIKTETPWEPEEAAYDGVLLRDLLDYVKATGTVLSIRALNDYHADLSVFSKSIRPPIL